MGFTTSDSFLIFSDCVEYFIDYLIKVWVENVRNKGEKMSIKLENIHIQVGIISGFGCFFSSQKVCQTDKSIIKITAY